MYKRQVQADRVDRAHARRAEQSADGRSGFADAVRVKEDVYKRQNAVFHTHSPYATAFAVNHQTIPAVLIEALVFLGGDIRCADYATPGTKEVGLNARPALEGRKGCTLANHGVLAVGGDLAQAYLNAEYCLLYTSACRLPEETEKKLLKDVDRLSRQPFGSAEASVLRNYLDTVRDMPWGVETKERVSVETARRRLDRDHYGLEKVKELILEFIAVRRLNPDARGQIICLVGPPGVGKTAIEMCRRDRS